MFVYDFKFKLNFDSPLFSISYFKKVFSQIAVNLGLNIVNEGYTIFNSPDGICSNYCHTGFYILSTSHLSWHTFPENNNFYLNLATCGDYIKPDEIIKMINVNFHCQVELISYSHNII